MKKFTLLFFYIVLVTAFSRVTAREMPGNLRMTSVCYAGERVNRMYVPPPTEYFKKAGMKGGASVTFYYSGFSDAAITAMEYAASILEALLPADAHLTVLATWTKLTSTGVLANSSSTILAGGWAIDAQKPFAYYPIALAEKIAGRSLNKDIEGDIELAINNSVNWYFGTDGNTPVLKYDLVTVVIHELIHGLGFVDSFKMSADDLTGLYGLSSIPLIYDTFVENNQGRILTDTLLFPNPSLYLKNEITSGNLYFNGPLLKTYTSGSRAMLYVPSTFDEGSSISHLDEDATLEVNQLMTPYIDRGEAIHDPGKYTMSMLGDLGWINTRIIYKPHKDTEEHLSELTIQATIKSDTVYNHNSFGFVWSFDKFVSCDTTYLTSPQADDNYTATILIPTYGTRIEYYLFVEDKFLRVYRLPSFIDKYHYSVYIGTDTVEPVINYTPEGYYFETIDTIRFKAEVTDNLGMDTVYIEYRVNEGNFHFLGLKADGEDGYFNSVSAKTLSVKGGDSLQYRIIAWDKAATANKKVLPSDGYFVARIERINPVADSYTTDFSDASGDFFNNGFNILKPAGFSNFGLHTPHPYVSPEETGDSIGYTSMLRTPIKFDANGMIISFMELVLVEPGEDGSVFGSSYFYDYVIVEGSRNFGKSWFHIADGYDCRIIDSWETAYNSVIDGYNSSYIGAENMLLKHTFFPKVSSDISAGDAMMVRFRLFSDPYANGWGWVIEDLHIGPLIDNVKEIIYQPLVIYPNPGKGLITIKQTEGIALKPVRFSIYNSAGTCIMTDYTDGGEEMNIDISGHPSGLYFIVLYRDDGIRTLKYNLIK